MASPTPRPTRTPLPLPTLRPDEMEVLQGWGDFPRMPVVSTSLHWRTDDGLYLLEGDRATFLSLFEGLSAYDCGDVAKLSPDGQHITIMPKWEHQYQYVNTLEVVNTQSASRTRVYEEVKGEDGSSSWERLLSFAWLDDEQILYTIQRPRDPALCQDPATDPCPVPGELWLTDLEGKKQLLLAADDLHSILGVSPDGRQVYLLRYAASWNPGGQGEWFDLALLDLDSRKIQVLWPEEGAEESLYTHYRLVTLPDGTQRVVFSEWHRDVPPIWMFDPTSGRSTVVWTHEGEILHPSLETPWCFHWSPDSATTFVYLLENGLWWVDLETSHTRHLVEGSTRLLAWGPEGIVIQRQADTFQILDEEGAIQGEIHIGPQGERRIV
jgi:hypothetical protein